MKAQETILKEWQSQSSKRTLATILMMDGVSFRFTAEAGIVFTAPEEYVAKLTNRMMACHGCNTRPVFNEVK